MTHSRYRLSAMLGSLSVAAFLLSTSGIALSPFLQAIADDLGTQLVAITSLLSFMAVSWGIGSLLIGALSDRLGRRPILLAAVLAMSVVQLGFSQTPNYWLAAVYQILVGLCGGAFFGTVFAAVSDHVPNQRRGSALGWIITGQSMSLVLGVPLIALLGTFGGWRGAILIYAIAIALTVLLIRLTVPADPPRPRSSGEQTRTPLRALLRADILLLLGAGITERTCFAIIAVYLALYLQSSYGVSLTRLAFGLAFVASGNVAGNLLGGQLADRIRARTLLYALSALATAGLALPLMLWQPGLGVSISLGFLYTFSNAFGRPALVATLSEVPPDVRGAVFGMNVTSASVGWLTSAALGGWLVTHTGFGALGLLCALAAALGAVLGFAHWRMRYR